MQRFVVMAFVAVQVTLVHPAMTLAQTGQSAATAIEVQTLADGLVLLKRASQNTPVLLTDLGVVVVDPGRSDAGTFVLAAIQRITDRPVSTLVNSHSHADHTGANERFGTTIDIVAHEQTRKNMERSGMFGAGGTNFLPKLMVRDRMTIGAGRTRIELRYFGRAHTNGDLWVIFPALGVAYAGDVFPGRELPAIDGSQGGSGLDYPGTLQRAAAALGSIDTIVSGHAGVMRRADFDGFQVLVRDFHDVVVDGFNRGMSVDEVIARWDTNAPAGSAAAPRERVRSNVEYLFGELASY